MKTASDIAAEALEAIIGMEAGSRGAYSKFADAQAIASRAIVAMRSAEQSSADSAETAWPKVTWWNGSQVRPGYIAECLEAYSKIRPGANRDKFAMAAAAKFIRTVIAAPPSASARTEPQSASVVQHDDLIALNGDLADQLAGMQDAAETLLAQYDFGAGHCLGVMSDGKACFKGSFLEKLEALKTALAHCQADSSPQIAGWDHDADMEEAPLPRSQAGSEQQSAKDAIEECARIVERWSLPTIQTPSMWLVDKAGIAAEIRALTRPQRTEG